MKQIVNVNISGIAFTLDRECYAILTSFLEQTRQTMLNNPERESIMADIEASIAEQILSVQSNEMPISESTLIPIIEGMGGTVSDLRSQPFATDQQQQQSQNLTKRLYRNSKGAVFGGVCSGMASYFNVDIVIFRLLFVIPFLFAGIAMIWDWFDLFHFTSFSINATSIMIYIILWIVIPQARTPRQKLEMVGDKVTVDTIAGTTAEPIRRGNEAGHVFAVILKVIALFFGISLLVSAIVATSAWLIYLSIEMARNHTPIYDIISVFNLSQGWLASWAAVVILLPFVAVFYLILGSVLNFKGVKIVVWSLFISWIILLLGAFFYVLAHIGELALISEYW